MGGGRVRTAPPHLFALVTLLEDLDFSFRFLRVVDCENYSSFLRVRASEQYLVLEFGCNLNQGCSGVGTAFPHLFFSAPALVTCVLSSTEFYFRPVTHEGLWKKNAEKASASFMPLHSCARLQLHSCARLLLHSCTRLLLGTNIICCGTCQTRVDGGAGLSGQVWEQRFSVGGFAQ